jgi:exodeoxyribonuclease VII large subunit
MANAELPIFSVSDFLASLNQTLEYAYPTIEIEGEVSSFKVNQGKFVFFDLKDQGGSIGCFMTVWQLRVPIEDGMKVIIRATPKLTNWGKFSLTVQSIRPSGEGSLKKSFELLKAKLDQEGLFGPERKRPLPYPPKHIAVISSTQAAGYADFIKIIDDRWGGVRVEVAHVQVQGEVAADQIIRAINYFNERDDLPEVIVLIRGGGSADDLAVFNDEQLVHRIASSRIPTLVGVGHEVDVTLADLVADVRAATPSNAAQIVVPDRAEISRTVGSSLSRIVRRTEYSIDAIDQQVRELLGGAHDSFIERIEMLEVAVERSRRILGAFNPLAVLERGYALVRGDLVTGGLVQIETSTKIVNAEVKDVKNR